MTARVRNVSRGGVQLLVDGPIQIGTMVHLELRRRRLGGGTAVLACVAHCQALAAGGFVVGCNFSTELGDADLRLLGAKRLAAPEGDQRDWERVPAEGRVIYTGVHPPCPPRPAEIHNLSPTGVALRTRERLTPGTLLSLELCDRDGRGVLTLVACVVYLSDLGDDRWLVGCNFACELEDEDVRAIAGQGA